jgi:intraflagellar transport protein 52
LFDLDEHFANEKTRLHQLAAKCTDDDLVDYERVWKILGIMEKLGPDNRDGRGVLNHVFKSIVNWKKFDQ